MTKSLEHNGMEVILKSLEAFRAAVDMALIISITDLEGRIIYVNRRFVEVSKYSAEELVGQKHNIVNSGYHPPSFFEDLWKTITAGRYWRGEIRNRARDGSYYWVDTVITPVLDSDGKISQYLSVRNLISKQKDQEEKLVLATGELRKREQQLKEAQQVAKTGSWHLELPQNRITWTDETYRIFDVPAGTPMTYDEFLERIIPEDRQMVNSAWNAALQGAPYSIEHRINTRQGIRWVREQAQLEFDTEGRLTGAVGTTQDITEKKKADDLLQETLALYKSLFDKSPFPLGILEKETMRFMEVNDAATRLYGYSRDEFLTMSAFDFRDPKEHNILRKHLAAGTYTRDTGVRLHRTKNGNPIKVEPTITEIAYRGKQAFLITISDVTEKLKMQEDIIRSTTERQHDINRATLEALEITRAEIGRELHDNINQLLAASTLYLKNAKARSKKDDEWIQTSRSIITDAIQEIKKLTSSIVPPDLKHQHLKEALEDLLGSFSLAGLKIECSMRLEEDKLSDALKLNIYRIIQEQMNNILKHAGATRTDIKLLQKERSLALDIQDNGNGFDPSQKSMGIGLKNITHRAESYNGELELYSSPGQGCRIRIVFKW